MKNKKTRTSRKTPALKSYRWSDLLQIEQAERLVLRDRIAKLETLTGGVWKMRDGTLIAIRDMSDSHLKNSLRMEPTSENLKKEIERRRVDKEWAGRSNEAKSIEDRLLAVEAAAQPSSIAQNAPYDRVKALETEIRRLQSQVAKLEAQPRAVSNPRSQSTKPPSRGRAAILISSLRGEQRTRHCLD